jgi:hypothetical protein
MVHVLETAKSILKAGNPYGRERLSTVDLLLKKACIVKKKKKFSTKSS